MIALINSHRLAQRHRTLRATLVVAVAAVQLQILNPLACAEPPKIIATDPHGHGLLCQVDGKRVLIVDGTPEQMGTAQGTLLKEQTRKLTERVLYFVGGLDTLHGDYWFLDRMDSIAKRTSPHIPERFLREIDALSVAADMSQRDGRLANLFPERFHCSGVAVCGKASKDGKVYHARVLDYMRDINLQGAAAVQVYRPTGRHAWLSVGYAGFCGTVTAMNERGLAVGEMGGRGEGDWDGCPMSLLLRDIMERAGTVEEALDILKQTPRTCEYYYVFSDKQRHLAGVQATAKELVILKPGEQNPRLPFVPADTVLMSGDTRAKTLSERLQQEFGQIDVSKMIELIKRPVAMNSNLHNAIFVPEDLDVYFADAGRTTPACDERYARCNLRELLEFYERGRK